MAAEKMIGDIQAPLLSDWYIKKKDTQFMEQIRNVGSTLPPTLEKYDLMPTEGKIKVIKELKGQLLLWGMQAT